MRTTIDLDESVLKRLRDEAQSQGVPFRAMLHRVIQRGLEASVEREEVAYAAPSHAMGRVREGVDFVKALQLSAALEDEEIIQKLAQRR